MRRWRPFLVVLGIILAAVVAGFFDFPEQTNRGIGRINAKKNAVSFLAKTPNIPQIRNIPFRLGLDLQGGVHLVYQANLSNVQRADYDSAMESLRDAVERRVNFFGVSEPVVQTEGRGENRRLIVELAGILDPGQAIRLINRAPLLEFKELLSEEERKSRIQKALPKETEEIPIDTPCYDINFLTGFIFTYQEDPCYVSTGLTGGDLKRAEVGFGNLAQEPLINLTFSGEGGKKFEEITTRNVGKPLAIYLDGLPLQTPTVQNAISGGRAEITGKFTLEEARQIVRNLNAGAIPVPVTLISQQAVGPTLGKASLDQSLKAALFCFVFVAFFMAVAFRVPGLLATLALFIYIILILLSFKLFSMTLTLAGIAGFILSIGMAVDANVLVFSRMREELKEGKSFGASVEEGFRRAWPSIRDGNITTLLVAFILFWFGSSFVQGFALTLSIGILVSIISAIFVTKNFLRVFVGTPLERVAWLWK